ncbi:hypothetical protein [Leptospira sp. GIMC2001]|uniref:hypothetical protein n=1 Tax=Leptospira sp. GIMC2001 TaxID=1513297 RepID=UPI002349DE3B|nr:hypothetical protein [Leptospira sp. GIMC2001]WCL50062.1 hypothetical protein O4O04_04385 [Leptospira sp. GIMC2001]
MKNRFKIVLLFITLMIYLPVSADSVKINKTGTVFENVKSTTADGVVSVDFEDGTNKKFRTRDVTVTAGETVWLADAKKEEKGFFTRIMQPDPEPEEKEVASEEGEKSKSYLGEGIFGTVALLFLILP